jgi:hypothetical protein
MAVNGFRERWGRETRLLVLVVVVSLAVLLLLARFRFPASTLNVSAPTPSPLAGLAGRADFEDLAGTVKALRARLASKLVVVQYDAVREPAGRGPTRGAGSRSGAAAVLQEPAVPPSLLVGLRVRADLALVHVPAGLYPASVLGSSGPAEVAAANTRRAIALVRIPSVSDFRPDPSLDPFEGFDYVGQVEGTAYGPTLQPVFVGRVDPVVDAEWPSALLAVGQAPHLSNGAFVFSMAGRFIGMIVRDTSGAMLVPASVLETAVNELAPGGATTP